MLSTAIIHHNNVSNHQWINYGSASRPRTTCLRGFCSELFLGGHQLLQEGRRLSLSAGLWFPGEVAMAGLIKHGWNIPQLYGGFNS